MTRDHDSPASDGVAPDVTLRLATIDDARSLHRWVNDPATLRAKLRTRRPIPRGEHVRWLRERLDDPDTAIWVIEAGTTAIGQVRLQRSDAGLEVDIFVVPEARDTGVATAALAQTGTHAGRRWPGLPLIARIKPENLASRRLFEAAGYRLARTEDDHLVYRLG